jgi:chromosome segregation ATPase
MQPPEENALSPRLARALNAERDDVQRRLRGLERERARLRAALASAEAEIQTLDERLVLLERLQGEDASASSRRRDELPDTPQVLTGPAIRATAVGVLRASPEGEGPIHYRRWLELVEEAGYEVTGKKPAATFLSQITRSPVVRRTTRAGFYELDRQATAALRRRVAALRAALNSGSSRETDPIDLDAVRRHRAELTREIERTERRLQEATDAFTLPIAQLAHTA